MKFEIREYVAATVAKVDGEIERSLGAASRPLEVFEADSPAAARKMAVKLLGDRGFNTANYTDVVEPVVCCWLINDSFLIALDVV